MSIENMSNWQQRNYFWFLCDKKTKNELTEHEMKDFDILNKKFIA